jgi:hypothetical protein
MSTTGNLSYLIGSKIVSITKLHDYWQLRLGDDLITIYNPLNLEGFSRDDPSRTSAGLFLTNVEESKDAIVLRFSGGATLAIDLRDESYSGPEAVVLTKHTGEIIVW